MGLTKTYQSKANLGGRPPVCSRKRVAYSRTFFPSDEIEKIAAETGLIERRRKITGQFLATTLAFWKGDTIGYKDLATEISLHIKIDITKQALHTKLQKSALFFETLVTKALDRSRLLPPQQVVAIPGVGDIYISDSSVFALNPKLADRLQGSGGSGPAAAAKLHALINMSSQRFARIALTDGRTSDHSEKEAHRSTLKKSDLIIRDMGYFELTDLAKLQAEERFFLTRIPLSLKTFTDGSGTAVDLWSKIIASPHLLTLDFPLVVGEEKSFPTRVLALRLPKAQAQKRLAAARKNKGRALTELEKAQARWNLFMTNLLVEQASAKTLKALYSWRWQVELVWKVLKSVLDTGSVKSATCETVVRAYIWARLLYGVVMMIVRSLIQKERDREIGMLCWYRRLSPQLGSMRELLRDEKWCALARLLITVATKHCSGGKRERKTSLEKINKSK